MGGIFYHFLPESEDFRLCLILHIGYMQCKMGNVSKEQTSRYRQEVTKAIKRLEEHYLKAGHVDRLFGGTPLEVYRRCGKATCRCAKGGEFRHGPYRVIGVRDGNTVRQITLRKDEGHYFEMAKHYQWQMQNRKEILELQEELIKKLDAMLEARTIWDKAERQKRRRVRSNK